MVNVDKNVKPESILVIIKLQFLILLSVAKRYEVI